jgi:hypothetical protein
MGIDTTVFFVALVALSVRTPNCFVVEHVKVWISAKFLNQVYWYLCLRVSERAIFPVFTNAMFLGETSTKLSFVLIWVIKLFYPCVTITTALSLWATFFLCNKRAKFRSVVSKFTSFVFSFVMEIWTTFQVVITKLFCTFIRLEYREIQKVNKRLS